MEINREENAKCYEAISTQHHPAVHTFQTVTEKKKAFPRSLKEVRGRKFLDYKGNSVKLYGDCGTGEGVSTSGINAVCQVH